MSNNVRICMLLDQVDWACSADDGSEIECGDFSDNNEDDDQPVGGLGPLRGGVQFFRIANTTDKIVWAAEQSERQLSAGGGGFNLDVAGIIGIGAKQPNTKTQLPRTPQLERWRCTGIAIVEGYN